MPKPPQPGNQPAVPTVGNYLHHRCMEIRGIPKEVLEEPILRALGFRTKPECKRLLDRSAKGFASEPLGLYSDIRLGNITALAAKAGKAGEADVLDAAQRVTEAAGNVGDADGKAEAVRKVSEALRQLHAVAGDGIRKDIADLLDILNPPPPVPSAVRKEVSQPGIPITEDMMMDLERLNAELFRAAEENDVNGAEKALKSGAEVDARSNISQTPLMRASCYGHLGMMRLLVRWKAKVDAHDDGGYTALMLAALGDQIKAAAFLISSGANACKTNNANQTARMLAQQNGHTKMAKLLEEYDEQGQKDAVAPKPGKGLAGVVLGGFKEGYEQRVAGAGAKGEALAGGLEIIDPPVEPEGEAGNALGDTGLTEERLARALGGDAGGAKQKRPRTIPITDDMVEDMKTEDGEEVSIDDIVLSDSVLFTLIVDEDVIELGDSDIEGVEVLNAPEAGAEDSEEREKTKMFRLKKPLSMQAGPAGPAIDMGMVMSEVPEGGRIQAIYADKDAVPEDLQKLFPPEQPRWVMDSGEFDSRKFSGRVQPVPIGRVNMSGRELCVFDSPVPGAKKLMAIDLECNYTPKGEMLNVRRKSVGSLNSDKSIMELFSGVKARSEEAGTQPKPPQERVGSMNFDESIMEMFCNLRNPNKGKRKKK